MRDEDWIKHYYQYGTIDRRSEQVDNQKTLQKIGSINKGIRIVKYATLFWASIIKNITTARR